MPSILTFDELKRYNSSILNESTNLIKTSALGGLPYIETGDKTITKATFGGNNLV